MPEHSPPEAMLSLAVRIRRALEDIVLQVEETCRRGQISHRRAALLHAYRLRRKWRKADARRLHEIGVSASALTHLQRVKAGKSPGRGVVQQYEPLGAAISRLAAMVEAACDPKTASYDRIKILKRTPWWPYFVESLYRGERADAKRKGAKEPSVTAERSVADCTGLTDATVHKLCEKVRRERREGNAPPDSPSLRVTEFKAWMLSGGDLGPDFSSSQAQTSR